MLGTNELAENLSGAVNHVGLRRACGTVKLFELVIVVVDGQEIELVVAKEALVGAVRIIVTDGQDCDFVSHAALQPVQIRNFFDAWGAPGGPQVQEDNLTAIVVQRNRVIGIVESKVRSRFSGHSCVRAVGTARKGTDRPCKQGDAE